MLLQVVAGVVYHRERLAAVGVFVIKSLILGVIIGTILPLYFITIAIGLSLQYGMAKAGVCLFILGGTTLAVQIIRMRYQETECGANATAENTPDGNLATGAHRHNHVSARTNMTTNTGVLCGRTTCSAHTPTTNREQTR